MPLRRAAGKFSSLLSYFSYCSSCSSCSALVFIGYRCRGSDCDLSYNANAILKCKHGRRDEQISAAMTGYMHYLRLLFFTWSVFEIKNGLFDKKMYCTIYLKVSVFFYSFFVQWQKRLKDVLETEKIIIRPRCTSPRCCASCRLPSRRCRRCLWTSRSCRIGRRSDCRPRCSDIRCSFRIVEFVLARSLCDFAVLF